MTVWSLTAAALALLLTGTVVAVSRGDVVERAAGLQLANVLVTLLAVVVAIGSGRRIVLDVALVLAVLSFAAGLAYGRFVERWL